MKRKCIILYDNGTYRFMSIRHIKPTAIGDPNINLIFIPLFDHPNLYFPLKPSDISAYPMIKVKIDHRIFSYDYDEGIGDDIAAAEFWTTCYDIVEFGNAVYNLYKFRGASISIIESWVSGIAASFTSYPTRIVVERYIEHGKLEHKIDSKEMPSLESISGRFTGMPLDMRQSVDSHPQFASDDRMDCLKPFIYTPDEFEDLPHYYALRDQKHWGGIDVYTDVGEDDYLLVKLPNFGCYYYIDAESFNHISQPKNLKGVIIYPICCPISVMEMEKMSAPLKRSLVNRLKPTRADKERWRIALKNGTFYNPMDLELVADSGESYLMYYSLFPVIANYLDYFITASYGSFEDCNNLNFSMFGDDQYILSFNEYLEDKLSDVFLRMISTDRD